MNEAEKAAKAAERLEKKAVNARKRAESFAAGGAGEKDLAVALSPLSADGWHFLHDRVNPFGGNIDTIAIGPAGVIVMDAKAWNGELQVAGDKFKNDGFSKHDELRKSLEQAAVVQRSLDNEVQVSCGLVFTTQPAFGPEFVGGVTIVGTDHLVDGMRQMAPALTTAVIERMFRILSEAFPPAGTAPSAASGLQVVDSVDASMQFDRAHRLLYVTEWRGGGKRRLYLRTDGGQQLGYRDVIAETVHLEADADHPFARPVLEAVTPSGLQLDAKTLPKVKLEMPAGRLLGVMGKLWVSAVIGQVWKGQRLYVSVANPTQGLFKLGYVDIRTGWIKCEITGEMGESLGTADRFMIQMRDRLTGQT